VSHVVGADYLKKKEEKGNGVQARRKRSMNCLRKRNLQDHLRCRGDRRMRKKTNRNTWE